MKELFLPVRTAYALICALLVAGVTGFTTPIFVINAAVLIFANSFVFQYFVLHWAMKQMEEHKKRLKFLLMWTVATSIASVSAALFLLNIDWTAELEQVRTSFVGGAIAYTAAAAAFVGGSMARRAFTKHGGLG